MYDFCLTFFSCLKTHNDDLSGLVSLMFSACFGHSPPTPHADQMRGGGRCRRLVKVGHCHVPGLTTQHGLAQRRGHGFDGERAVSCGSQRNAGWPLCIRFMPKVCGGGELTTPRRLFLNPTPALRRLQAPSHGKPSRLRESPRLQTSSVLR